MFAETIHFVLNNTTNIRKWFAGDMGLIFSPKSHQKHRTQSRFIAKLKTNLKNQYKRGRRTYHQLVQPLVGIIMGSSNEEGTRHEMELLDGNVSVLNIVTACLLKQNR